MQARPCDAAGCRYRGKHDTGDGRMVCGVHNRSAARKPCHGECPVCLEGMDRGTTALACGHVFHARCLKNWFKNRPLSCPMCRSTCLEGMAIMGRVAPRLEALVRTVPPVPGQFFPTYIRSHLDTPLVRAALRDDEDLIELLMDVSGECFTRENFFRKVRALRL